MNEQEEQAPETAILFVKLPAELKRRYKEECRRRGLTMTQELTEHMRKLCPQTREEKP